MKCKYCEFEVSKDEFNINYISKSEAYHGACKTREELKKSLSDTKNGVKDKQ